MSSRYSFSVPRVLFPFVLIFTVLTVKPLLAKEGPPRYSKVPDFNLTERNGNEMKLADLKGKVWISDFIFTRCQGRCPLLSGQMAAFQEQLANSDIKLVSFSVDPEHDTPQILSGYAIRFKAQKGKWFFLTGPKKVMWDLITDGFSLGVDQAAPEDLAQGAEPVMHSNRFVLVDQDGYIRGYYDGTESSDMKSIVQDALTLISSLRGGRQADEAIPSTEIASASLKSTASQ